MTYLLQWRHSTPKGNPGKVDFKRGLDAEDVSAQILKLLGMTCWIHVEREDLNFAGMSRRKEKARA